MSGQSHFVRISHGFQRSTHEDSRGGTAALKPACLARDSERAVEMPAKLTIESDRILEPIERISEFLFGLIMAALKEDEPSVTGRS